MLHLPNKPEADPQLTFPPLSVSASFYGYLKLFKDFKRIRNRHLTSLVGMEHGTSGTEGQRLASKEKMEGEYLCHLTYNA